MMDQNKSLSQRLLKILIIGNSGVGKSCILMRYIQNNFTTAFYNTIGVDFKMKSIVIDGRRVRVQIWDTAGQDRFKTITSTYYKGAQGIILVYDVTDPQSFEGLKFWQSEIDKYASQSVEKILVANKTDLIQKRCITLARGLQYANNSGLPYIEVSALSDDKIAEAFQTIARKVLKKIDVSTQAAQGNGGKVLVGGGGGKGQNNGSHASETGSPCAC